MATIGPILVHEQPVLCTAISVLAGHDELQKLSIHIRPTLFEQGLCQFQNNGC
jgi:hypothetical protein